MSKPVPRICCPRCGGNGQVVMPAKLVRVLEFLRVRDDEADAAMIHTVLNPVEPEPISINAINNRLEDLRDLGLVVRRRAGKRWMYYAPPIKQNNPVQAREASSGTAGSEAAKHGTSDNFA